MMNNDIHVPASFSGDPEAVNLSFGDAEIKYEYKKKVKSCLVCGDNAFYYFYGAITCDSCRTFFRRQILQFKPLKCPFSGNCVINNTTRKDCSKCRLAKCLQVGMRKDLIVNAKEERRQKQNYTFVEPNVTPNDASKDMFATTSGLINTQQTLRTSASGQTDTSTYDREYENYLAYCASYTNSFAAANTIDRFASLSSASGAPFLIPQMTNATGNNGNPAFALNQMNMEDYRQHSSLLIDTINSQHVPSSSLLRSMNVLNLQPNAFTNEMQTQRTEMTFSSGSNLYEASHDTGERIDRLDTSSCDSFPLDRSPGLAATSESDCESWTNSDLSRSGLYGNGSSPSAEVNINYNWKKRKLRILTNGEKENHLLTGCHGDDTSDDGECNEYNVNHCLPGCGVHHLDPKQMKRQRLDEILNAAARIMRSPCYRLDRLERLSEGARHSQRLEALKWQFFGISKLSRAFIEIGAYRRLRDSQRRALLKANCTELLMLSSARYFDPQNECWQINVRLHPNGSINSASTVQLPVPVNVMDMGQAHELSRLYFRFMDKFDRKWLEDDVLMTLVFVIALFCPDTRLCRLICHIRNEYDCYQSLLREHLVEKFGSMQQADIEFERIEKMFIRLNEFKNVYENTYVPLDGDEKNLLYTHLTEQLAV